MRYEIYMFEFFDRTIKSSKKLRKMFFLALIMVTIAFFIFEGGFYE